MLQSSSTLFKKVTCYLQSTKKTIVKYGKMTMIPTKFILVNLLIEIMFSAAAC